MCDCTCHENYTLDTLIPKVGVITDIRQETPDVKTFRVVGNFSKSPVKYAVPEGSWKDYKAAETVSGEIVLKNGEYRIIVK